MRITTKGLLWKIQVHFPWESQTTAFIGKSLLQRVRKIILHLSSANSGSFSVQYQEYLLLHFPF